MFSGMEELEQFVARLVECPRPPRGGYFTIHMPIYYAGKYYDIAANKDILLEYISHISNNTREFGAQGFIQFLRTLK